MHDPFVKQDDQNLLKFDQQGRFSQDLKAVLDQADFVIVAVAHKVYEETLPSLMPSSVKGVIDAANAFNGSEFNVPGLQYTGIGRGTADPDDALVEYVYNAFLSMEKGVARELKMLIDFYNGHYVSDAYNQVDFSAVQELASTCSTGCEIADPGDEMEVAVHQGLSFALPGLPSARKIEVV
jgi:hypothetical protein